MLTKESLNKLQSGFLTRRIAIVIPVYNHPARLKEIVCRCIEYCPKIVVVDDGSDEQVAPSLKDLPVEVLRHQTNLGKGAAIYTAAFHLIKQGHTHIITIDADGQHYPDDLPKMIKAIEEHPEDLIVGVRDFNNESVPAASRFGRSFGNFWGRIQTGTKIGDIQSGFRAYPVSIIEQLPCWSKGFAFEVEFLVRALWGGVKVHEVNVPVHYPKTEKRISHFHTVRDNSKLALLNTHLTIRSFLPWPHRKLTGPDADPKKSVTIFHPLRSIKMMLMERATPKELAFAAILGVFIGASPLFGAHTLLILMAAALLKLNRIAAVAASQVCMPPLVPAICILVGHFLRYGQSFTIEGIKSLQADSFIQLGYMGLSCLWDWFLGFLIIGPVLALIFGALTYITAIVLRRLGRAF